MIGLFASTYSSVILECNKERIEKPSEARIRITQLFNYASIHQLLGTIIVRDITHSEAIVRFNKDELNFYDILLLKSSIYEF